MRINYSDMDIRFYIDDVRFHALNIIFERFTRTIPSHSHGNGCYEIHYIPHGRGRLTANQREYEITPNTLFVTGPQIDHAQAPDPQDPMQEYCIYLKVSSPTSRPHSSVVDAFLAAPFWIGQDSQGVHTLMRQLFDELEHCYTGYVEQVKLLLGQLLICLVRNYEQRRDSAQHFAPNNLSDSKSVIIEEYFLYEYRTLSLDALSDRLKLSKRQTQRLLQEYYGKTFQQKKAEARMSAAAVLLRSREYSISYIADALGYSSSEHFSSAFRNYYHISPREFRNKSTS